MREKAKPISEQRRQKSNTKIKNMYGKRKRPGDCNKEIKSDAPYYFDFSHFLAIALSYARATVLQQLDKKAIHAIATKEAKLFASFRSAN